jgi:hypothetical protein
LVLESAVLISPGRFEIACDDTEPSVTSAGPDEQLSTEEDIT